MGIFFAIVIVSLILVAFVLKSLLKESHQDSSIEAIEPTIINDEFAEEIPTEETPAATEQPPPAELQPIEGEEIEMGEEVKEKKNFLKIFGALKGLGKKKNDDYLRIEDDIEEEGEEPKKKNPLANVLNKFKMGKKFMEPPPEPEPLPPLKDVLAEANKNKQAEQASENLGIDINEGTASLTTSPAESEPLTESKPQEETLEIPPMTEELDLQEIHAPTLDLQGKGEVKEKYENLERLYEEQTKELEKTKQALDNEIKNRKEFNKVKDLLEKELKETKDQKKNIKNELNNALSGNNNQKDVVHQYQEKISKLEQTISEKEQEIDNLVKRLQTFASPTTSAEPPQTEKQPAEPELPTSPPEEKQPSSDEKTFKIEPDLDITQNTTIDLSSHDDTQSDRMQSSLEPLDQEPDIQHVEESSEKKASFENSNNDSPAVEREEMENDQSSQSEKSISFESEAPDFQSQKNDQSSDFLKLRPDPAESQDETSQDDQTTKKKDNDNPKE